jgi:hypothetical protein
MYERIQLFQYKLYITVLLLTGTCTLNVITLAFNGGIFIRNCSEFCAKYVMLSAYDKTSWSDANNSVSIILSPYGKVR